ncbi:hypothetical protein PO124_12105 [Bacillus licheniformis]|nr:hypothetical protein [Bacillus licheniformis]
MNGTQTMTVYKPIPALAKKALKWLFKRRKAKRFKPIQPSKRQSQSTGDLLEPYAVTKGNINETVIKDGHLSKKILINKRSQPSATGWLTLLNFHFHIGAFLKLFDLLSEFSCLFAV